MRITTCLFIVFFWGCTSCKEKDVRPSIQIFNSEFEQYLVESGKDSDGEVNGRMSVIDQKKSTDITFLGFLSDDLINDRINFNHITSLYTRTADRVFNLENFPKLDSVILRHKPGTSETLFSVKGSNINYLRLENLAVDSIDVSGLSQIGEFHVSGTFRSIKLNDRLTTLKLLGSNNLRQIDFLRSGQGFLWLKNVSINGTGINTLSFPKCRDLVSLDCGGNKNLTKLDISDVKNLNQLDARKSFIREICVNDVEQAELRTKLIWYYSITTPHYYFNIENGTKFIICN